ncbi:hypothetical protein [Nannocystis pusilla]|uniref:Uncharacterized protein n=1 Tax=Nannocystis pusilla TaxID=889268 RepID=A0ABS7TKC3_9BACT|nr:hypothetical protein [Nannocystis pusilla]MBZ5708664.1 hypothetical protein [Nannocystis pusilla]
MAVRRTFPNEHELCNWNSVSLTTHRVLQGDSDISGSRSILLHTVNGTSVSKSAHAIFIVAAAVVGVGGLASRHVEVGSLLAGALVLAYFMTREVVFTVYGDGRKISRTVKGGAADVRQALEFADRIDRLACLVTRSPEVEPRVRGDVPPPL